MSSIDARRFHITRLVQRQIGAELMTFSISHPEAAPVALSANPAFVVDFLDRFKNFPAFFTPLENFSVTERLNVFISQKSFASVALPLIASGIASIVLRAAPFFIALADDVAPLIFQFELELESGQW